MSKKFYVCKIRNSIGGSYYVTTTGLATLEYLLKKKFYNDGQEGEIFVLADGEFLYENGEFKKVADPRQFKTKKYPLTYDIPNETEDEVKQFRDAAFRPLVDFLDEFYQDEKDEIMSCMMFMGHEDGRGKSDRFLYKNNWTRRWIMMNQYGEVYHHEGDALYHGQEDNYIESTS